MPLFEAPAPEKPMPVATPVSFEEIDPAEIPPAPQEDKASFTPFKVDLPSDLQQVESNPDKVHTAEQQEPEEETSHPRRVRSTPPRVNDEPLVQVETGQSSPPAEESAITTPPRQSGNS
jgi:hypothetical protein